MVASAGHAASTMIKRRTEICKRKFFVRESGRRYEARAYRTSGEVCQIADQIPGRVDVRCACGSGTQLRGRTDALAQRLGRRLYNRATAALRDLDADGMLNTART